MGSLWSPGMDGRTDGRRSQRLPLSQPQILQIHINSGLSCRRTAGVECLSFPAPRPEILADSLKDGRTDGRSDGQSTVHVKCWSVSWLHRKKHKEDPGGGRMPAVELLLVFLIRDSPPQMDSLREVASSDGQVGVCVSGRGLWADQAHSLFWNWAGIAVQAGQDTYNRRRRGRTWNKCIN